MRTIEAGREFQEAIDKFYANEGYHSGWSENERAFICLSEKQIIGCVKLEFREKVIVLRGMYIASNFQKKQVGTKLLKFIEPILNESKSYCIPFSHLTRFYNKINFMDAKLENIPRFLFERYKSYQEKGYNVKVMCRD